jgi:uncharacterized protein YjbI with pentapeptide repeats
MKIKRLTQVLGVLMVALFFVTNVNAFSGKIHKNTAQSKEWQNPFFQLELDIARLKKEIAALQNRIDTMTSQNSTADFDDMKLGKYHLILPRGYFVQSMHEFDQFDFSGAYLKQSYFIEAVLTRTNFCGANLKMSSFYNATLNEVIFSGADLNKADFRGAKMTNVIWGDQECGYAICPDGTNAAENAGTCEGHLSN